MNQALAKQDNIPMNSVGMSATGTGTKIAPQNLGEVVKFAEVMARADIALPKHLRGNPGACMAVALQAMEWQLSPFAVASKSYAVNGAIAYEAQLIAAVVNTRSGIKGRLKYQFDGTGADMRCTVTGVLDGEECSYTSPRVGEITTKNSPLWKTDAQQQLGYYSARSWARRHCPEVILGVYDRDEAEEFRGPDRAKDITPPAFNPLDDDPLPQTTQQADNEWLSDGEVGQGEQEKNTSSNSVEGVPETSTEQEAEALPPASASAPLSAEIRRHLIDYARKGFSTLSGDLEAKNMQYHLTKMEADYRDAIQDADWPRFETITRCFNAVLKGAREIEQARAFVAGELLDCSVSEIGG